MSDSVLQGLRDNPCYVILHTVDLVSGVKCTQMTWPALPMKPCLRERQRIHVRAQSHHRRRAAANGGHKPGRGDLLEGDTHVGEFTLHQRGGPVLVPQELGDQV